LKASESSFIRNKVNQRISISILNITNLQTKLK